MADIPPPPPSPAPETRKQGGVRRAWAIVGIVAGFLFLIVPGFFAIRSYRRWRAGTIAKPIFAWTFGWIGVAYLALVGVGSVVLDQVLTDELIDVEFREGIAPFESGQTSSGNRFDHVEGSYRFTIKDVRGPSSSVGEFVRTAYAVGVRAEVVEITERGTTVGAMCLGPAEGEEGPVGYGFFVTPGGEYILGRQTPDQRIEFLEQGTDPRIATVERVSVTCVPSGIEPVLGGSTDVTVVGYANGLEVVTTQDPNGYDTYTHAGLSVVADQPGAEVRFTRVLARVPDEEWAP